MDTQLRYKVNAHGHLEVGGADCLELARTFGTPLYVYDEARIRSMMRLYRDTLRELCENSLVLYASKAFSCKAMYAIAKQEDIGADVVSGGELYTAMQAGFPAERIYMHGNNKLPEELRYALGCGVGCIVVDAMSEADLLEAEAARRNTVQKVLIRINPGVEAHTHAYVQTATPDCKFGFSVADGSAEEMVRHVLTLPHLRLAGFHCHIGSQIFEKQSFALAAEKCVDFIAKIKRETAFEAEELNMGGGFGVWYAEGDAAMGPEDYRAFLTCMADAVKARCATYGLALPRILIEPGRSIVGEAGVTLYTVGAVKRIKGLKTYLSVDGGMFENPRYCLYRSRYTAISAARAAEQPTELVSLAGKCCESGDLIGENMPLQHVETGDILAVLSTGAYNYSMASNYNRNLIPPAILVKDGRARYIVRPQTYSDIVRLDELPEDFT